MSPAHLADHLEKERRLRLPPVVAGFDAFVDEVLHVVGRRLSPEEYTPVPTISDFGQWVSNAAGRSGSREFVVLERVAGGCSVNLGDAIMSLGFSLDAFAGVGDPSDPAFRKFSCECSSLNPLGMEPGRTAAYEFQDGKLMLCSFSHFTNFTPEYLSAQMADGLFRRACENSSALVLTSWSVYPHMTECWKYLQREQLAGIKNRPRIFLDIADPASRSPEDLCRMADALAGFEAIGPTTLSLNSNEATQLAGALSLRTADSAPEDVEKLAAQLQERLGIDEVGIHLIKSATAADSGGAVTVAGPHCTKPMKSVGAGDRFNAGWLAGSLLGLASADRLLFAVAVSGFFVRNARSGTFPEIIKFLRDWSAGVIDSGNL
jgi:sugar/nucleoside kinase (ribokinase family)